MAKSDRLFRVRDARTIQRPSGMKMTGPYDYVPPSYWLIDTKHGGLRVQHETSRSGSANPEFAQKVYPRRSSVADGEAKVSVDRTATVAGKDKYGISTPAAANLRTSLRPITQR